MKYNFIQTKDLMLVHCIEIISNVQSFMNISILISFVAFLCSIDRIKMIVVQREL